MSLLNALNNAAGSALGGAAISGAGAVGGGFLSNHFAKQAYKRNVKAYKNRYLWTTRDLKRAGLNPILAVGGLSGGSASGPGGSMESLGGAVSRGAGVGIQARVAKENLLNMVAQRGLIEDQAAKVRAETAAIQGSTPKRQFEGEVYELLRDGAIYLKGKLPEVKAWLEGKLKEIKETRDPDEVARKRSDTEKALIQIMIQNGMPSEEASDHVKFFTQGM